MLFLMLVSLYTSRVILHALGVTDYGIYNVVGGVVSMFTLLCGSISTAISRFITFELGKNDKGRLSTVFSTSFNIQIVMSLLIILVSELIGVWFINEKMVIPLERQLSANLIFHFSVLTFALNLICIPYNASIIAHEQMKAFAYLGIYEAVAKLIVAYFIIISPFDRLVFYGLLISLIQISLCLFYSIYCRKHFSECTYRFCFDKSLLRDILSFTGWTFIGSSSIHLRDQGGNILLNLFFGPVVNAARGIAMQVNNAVQQFVTNFMMALNPQITKSYANNEYDYMLKLVFKGGKFSFYLLLFISLPILVNTDYIIGLWLKEVPDYTSIFVKLILILSMSDSLSNPFSTAQSATGRVRNYQLVVGTTQLLYIPIVYFFLKAGYDPTISIVVAIALSQVCLFLRVHMFRKCVNFSFLYYFKQIYLNVLLVAILSSILPTIFSSLFKMNLFVFIIDSLLCFVLTANAIYFVGLNREEQLVLLSKLSLLRSRLYSNEK